MSKKAARTGKTSSTQYYFDDPDEGPSKQTSHPAFAAICKSPFFYDCADDFAPFGNDAGSDLLSHIEDNYRARRPKKLWNVVRAICDDWGIELAHINETRHAIVRRLLANSDTETNLIELDKIGIAAAFAQLKITGKVDADIHEAAMAIMQRQPIIRAHNDSAYPGWDDNKEKAKADKKIRAALEAMTPS